MAKDMVELEYERAIARAADSDEAYELNLRLTEYRRLFKIDNNYGTAEFWHDAYLQKAQAHLALSERVDKLTRQNEASRAVILAAAELLEEYACPAPDYLRRKTLRDQLQARLAEADLDG